MKSLNIAIYYESVEEFAGGQTKSVNRFTEKLKERGHNIIFLTTKKFAKANGLNKWLLKFKLYRFTSSLPIGPNKYRFVIEYSPKKIRRILVSEKIDVVYMITPSPFSYALMHVAKKLNIPVISHCHFQADNFFLTNRRIPIVKGALNRYLSFFYNKSACVIFPSEFAKRKIKKSWLKSKSAVISNGVDTDHFKKLKRQEYDYIYSKYKLHSDSLNLLSVGRLSREKNIETLIKAMPEIIENHPNVEAIIVGAGKLGNKYKKMAKKKGIKEHVRVLGEIPDKDIVPIFSTGDIFIHPSLVELEGMVVLEAMACGLPIVVSNSPSNASQDLINGNGFTFTQRKNPDLAKKIIYLLDHPAMIKSMSRVSRHLAKGYNIDKSVDKLESIFIKSVSSKKI